MIPRPLARAAVAAAVTLLAVAGCLPLPDVRGRPPSLAGAYRADPAAVRVTAAWVPGFDEPATPDELEGTTVLRFALDEPVETVVVAVPGLFGGASSFAPLARRLVATVPGLQVWALDRRANALEDRSPVRQALATGDPAPVVAGYLGADGAPPAFRAPDPAAFGFVARWGLEVHLRDLHEVVSQARATGARVVLAGHSMGASLVAVYAAWRTPHGPGHERIDGLVLLDGAPGRTGALDLRATLGVIGSVVLPGGEDLESGRARPWLTLGEGGSVFARRQAASVLAHLAPDADAPAAAAPYPLSNRAFAGLAHDDQYGLLTAFGASVGQVVGAELDGNLPAVFLAGASAFRSASVVGVAEGHDRVEWTAGDPARERTDLAELAAAWSDPRADVAEWYVPWRLLLELGDLAPDLLDLPGFLPASEVVVPTLAVGAGRGLLRGTADFEGYVEQRIGSPVSVAILPGLTHLDVVSARDNPAVTVMARWIALLR